MSALTKRRARVTVRVELLVLAVPFAVGALLCAVELGTRSLWIDESATYAITAQSGAGLWHGIAHDGGNMLLYYLLLHGIGVLFGHATWVMRMPSLLADALTASLVAMLGVRLLGDRRQAVVGGVLSAVSLPLVFWGQDARGYALMVTLATASMLTFLFVVEPGIGERETEPVPLSPRAALVAYVLTTTAALYVGFDAALVVLAQITLLPLCRVSARRVLAAIAVVAVLCLPLVALALARGSGQLFWVPALTWQILGESMLTLLSAGMSPNFHHTATTITTAIVTGIVLLGNLGIAVRLAVRTADRTTVWHLWVLVLWLVVPVGVAVLAYAVGEPVELQRVVILSMPGLALLLSWGLTRVSASWVPGPLLLAVLLSLRLVQVLPIYGTSPENWKAAVAYAARTERASHACVAFYPQDGRQVFDYYLNQGDSGLASHLRPILPTLPWGTVRPFVERYDTLTGSALSAATAGCSTLLLVASHVGQRDGPPASREHLRRYEQLRAALDARYAHHSMRSFGWAAPVDVISYSR